jgi:hypothetical protein
VSRRRGTRCEPDIVRIRRNPGIILCLTRRRRGEGGSKNYGPFEISRELGSEFPGNG